MIEKLVLFFSLVFIAGCGSSNRIADNISGINYIKSNIEFLASDELEGREAATRGERLASLFIAGELQKYGIKPFGDSGTYFQNFDVLLRSGDSNSTIAFIKDGKEKTFKINEDFFVYSGPDINLTGENFEIMFAGYGITAPEYDYDDFKNLDVSGKVIMILNGEPFSEDSSYFNGLKQTGYSRTTSKAKIAMSKGALGVIVIPDDFISSRWESYGDWVASPKFIYPADKKYELNIPIIYLSENAAKDFFIDERYNFAQLGEMKTSTKTLSFFDIGKDIKLSIRTVNKIENVRNVVGLLEGTDDILKNEYVSIGAHYDHAGIMHGEIYNGADDNASGTAAALEVARTLKSAGENKRSVLFVFHTAEEKGLIGADYFTNNVSVINDIAVNINLDMVGMGSSDTLHCVGSNMLSSELFDIVENANENSVNFSFNYKYNDPKDPERIFYRSDHYKYALKNIPSVFFTHDTFTFYHKPTDDAVNINFIKVNKVAQLVHRLALDISNLDHRLKSDLPLTR